MKQVLCASKLRLFLSNGVVISHTQDYVFVRAYLLDSAFGFCDCRIKMCILVFLIAIHVYDEWSISIAI